MKKLIRKIAISTALLIVLGFGMNIAKTAIDNSQIVSTQAVATSQLDDSTTAYTDTAMTVSVWNQVETFFPSVFTGIVILYLFYIGMSIGRAAKEHEQSQPK